MESPEFRIIEMKYPHPQTAARFWIEWYIDIEVEKKGFWSAFLRRLGFEPLTKTVKSWEIFSDPASTQINEGYQHIVDAQYAIDRYRINMKPIIHKYEHSIHQQKW